MPSMMPSLLLRIVVFCYLLGFSVLKLLAPVHDPEWVMSVRLLQWRDPQTHEVLEFRDPVNMSKVVVDREADLDVQVQQLQAMTSVSLSYQALTTLPPEIGYLENLTNLTVMCNELTALPPEIGNLRNLKHLAISHNYLETLPPQLGNLSQLEILIVNDNLLVNVPLEITQLTNLTQVYLQTNQIREVPDGFQERVSEGTLFLRIR